MTHDRDDDHVGDPSPEHEVEGHWQVLAQELGAAASRDAMDAPPPRIEVPPPMVRTRAIEPIRPPRASSDWDQLAGNLGASAERHQASPAMPKPPISEPPARLSSTPSTPPPAWTRMWPDPSEATESHRDPKDDDPQKELDRMFGADSTRTFEEEPSPPRYRDDVVMDEATDEIRFVAKLEGDLEPEPPETEEPRQGRSRRRRGSRRGREPSSSSRGASEERPTTRHDDSEPRRRPRTRNSANRPPASRVSPPPVPDEGLEEDPTDFGAGVFQSGGDEGEIDFAEDQDFTRDSGPYLDSDDVPASEADELPEERSAAGDRRVTTWKDAIGMIITRNMAHRGPEGGSGGHRRRRGGRRR